MGTDGATKPNNAMVCSFWGLFEAGVRERKVDGVRVVDGPSRGWDG